MNHHQSWGRFPAAFQKIKTLNWRSENLHLDSDSGLPQGQARSYGDVCLNAGGEIISTRGLSNIIEFDRENGLLHCEAGITLDEILRVIVPAGWFLPVTPGTRYVSLGGAIANDVHGKNHHCAGTFGRHVLSFELCRSDGSRLICSSNENIDLFNATIAGLGLTGLMISAKIKLIKIVSPLIRMDSIKFGSLDEFFKISGESEKTHDYTVAWIDCVSSGKNFGRGIFMRGNHDTRPDEALLKKFKCKSFPIGIPFNFPNFMLNKFTMGMFNTLYYNKQRQETVSLVQGYDTFFYPLDAVNNWNRLYGGQGFLQFQCVIPKEGALEGLKKLLSVTVASGKASFLAVLKEFGDLKSPGLLSFPRPGVTLCLDFAFNGVQTLELMHSLEECVRDLNGALYPAKDACMSGDTFRACYPKWEEFSKFVDPKFTSSFWRRVTLDSQG